MSQTLDVASLLIQQWWPKVNPNINIPKATVKLLNPEDFTQKSVNKQYEDKRTTQNDINTRDKNLPMDYRREARGGGVPLSSTAPAWGQILGHPATGYGGYYQ